MTAEEFRRARQILRLTNEQMAKMLGIANARTIRMYAAKDTAKWKRKVPEPIAKLVRAMLHGYDPITDTMRHKRTYLGEKPVKPRKQKATLQWAADAPFVGGFGPQGREGKGE